MNYSIYRFTLDIHKTKSQVSIPVLFHDTGIKFYISLTDGGKPYFIEDGCRAVFSAKKSDGKQLFNDCIIEDNTRIRYDFTEQTTNSEGMMNCEIRLYGKDGKLITTPAFVVVVDPRVIYDNDVTDSYPESTTLDGIVASEESRAAGEQQRVDAEAVRVIVENARVIAEEERVIAENARVDAEIKRATEEAARTNAEEDRKKSEAERAAAFASMLGSWVAYSMYEDGTDYTWTWSEGQRYIGIANGKTMPQDKTGFVWSKFVDTGVFVGSGDMPEWCDLQIDPDGEVTEIVQAAGQSSTDVMSQKAVSNTFANALKGTASGAEVSICDVSPIEHEMGVRVRKKNLLNIANAVSSHGTHEIGADGVITLTKGTTAYAARVYWELGAYDDFVGKTLTFSLTQTECSEGSNIIYFYADCNTSKAKQLANAAVNTGNKSVATVNGVPANTSGWSKLYAMYYCQGLKNEGEIAKIKEPQVEEGTTATAYAPYVEDVSAVKVLECGKNILPYPYYNKGKVVSGGITFTDNGDGTVTANGTATGNAQYIMVSSAENRILKAGTYTASGCPAGGSNSTYFIRFHPANKLDTGDGATVTLDADGVFYFNINIIAGTTVENLVFKPQLEIGGVVTKHVPPTEHIEHAVNADGAVKGVMGKGEDITLYTDTAGALIECSYNKDANKVIGSLIERLAALEAAAIN